MSAVSRAGGDDKMASGQDANRHDAVQLDSASMNEAMQQHIMAHMTEAELKVLGKRLFRTAPCCVRLRSQHLPSAGELGNTAAPRHMTHRLNR